MTVLTSASVVDCGHDPTAPIATEGAQKLTVSRQGVLVADGVRGKSIGSAACGLVPNQGPPVTARCTKVLSVSGEATKLTVGGRPVLLGAAFAGSTDGQLAGVTPQALMKATANQTKLTAA